MGVDAMQGDGVHHAVLLAVGAGDTHNEGSHCEEGGDPNNQAGRLLKLLYNGLACGQLRTHGRHACHHCNQNRSRKFIRR